MATQPHTRYQSESTLTAIVKGFDECQHNQVVEAYMAQSELDARRKRGGEFCHCCSGSGWFKERGPFSNDEICDDCNGLGTVYPFERGDHNA